MSASHKTALTTGQDSVASLLIAVADSEFKALTQIELRRLFGLQKNPVIGDLKAIFDKKPLERIGFKVTRL